MQEIKHSQSTLDLYNRNINTILRNSGYLSSIKQHPMYMQRIIENLHNYRYTQFINSQFIETIGDTKRE